MRKGNLKKILSFVLSLVMVLGLCSSVKMDKVQAADGVVFTITADKTDVKRGEVITVRAMMTGNANTKAYGLEWHIHYDGSKLEGINIGPIDEETGEQEAALGGLGGSIRKTVHNAGELNIVEGGLQRLQDGCVMETKFRVLDNATLGNIDFTQDLMIVNSKGDSLDNFSIDDQTKLSVVNPATGISLNKTSTTIAKNTTEKLEATLTPADSNSTVTWSSSNPAVATVAEDGTVTGVNVGTAKITATVEGISASCDVTVTNPLKGIVITCNDNKTALTKGQTAQLNVVYDPDDTTDPKEVKWTSSNDKVAKVDAKGLVTAVAEGNVTITAQVGDKTATYDFTIGEVKLTNISLDKTDITIHKGGNDKVTVIYDPENTTDDKTVSWSSSDKTVATVDGDGNVSAVKTGSAVITAKVGNFTATCKVTVDAPLESITPEKDVIDLVKNQTAEVKYTLNPSDTTSDKTVTFASDNVEVASVDENGIVTANAEGQAVVTITSNANPEIKGTVKVNVTEVPIDSVVLDKANATVEKNATTTLTATINPAATTDDDKTITWSTSNAEVATVAPENSASGEEVTVTAVNGGTATITATTANGKTAVCEIKVPVHTESIEITGFENGIVKLDRGTTRVLAVKFNPENTEDSKEIVWESTHPEIATVDETGTVHALKAGTTEITATTKVGNISDKKIITVEENNLDKDISEEIKFDAKKVEVVKNQSVNMNQYLNLNEIIEKKNITDDITVEWSVDDDSVATIDQNGLLTGIKKGTVKVTATVVAKNGDGEVVGTYEYSADVKVTEISLESIAFNKVIKEMKVGAKDTLSIIYNPENTTDVKDVTWESSDASVISVENGNLTALKAGKATITAVVGDKKVSMEITVTENQAGTGNGDKTGGNTGSSDTNGKGKTSDNNKATNDSKSVKTGDTTHVFIYMIMLFISGIAAMCLLLGRERRRSHRR